MTKTILTLILTACSMMNILAQSNTYLGVEGAVSHDIYDHFDNGSLLKKVPLLSGYVGFTIRQDLNQKTFLELGLLRKYYSEGIGFKTSDGFSTGDAISAWCFPLRLGTRINLSKQRVYLTPVIGYCLAVNTDYGYGDGGAGGVEIYNNDTLTYNVSSKLSLRRTFPLLQTGIGLEFPLLSKLLFSVAANYYTGFKNVIEQDIQYTHNGSTYTAKGLSKGEMVCLNLGLRYPISRLWQR